MKLFVLALFSTIAAAAAFAPATPVKQSAVVMNAEAEQSRKAFLSAAALAVFGAAAAPAFAMDQDNVNDPTEQWETGTPTPKAESARMSRYTNARTQMTSNFAPIKRLTLERKSPVVSSWYYDIVLRLLFHSPFAVTDINTHVVHNLYRLAWILTRPTLRPTRRPTPVSSVATRP